MTRKNGLLVVVNFNQEKEIAAFLGRLSAHYPKAQTVVVDDGSHDRSPAIAEELGYTVLRSATNRGIGAAIRTGILHAIEHAHDFVIIMSSNGKMRPEEIQTVIEPILTNRADYVQGSRFLRENTSIELTPFRRMAIPIFTSLANLALGRRFSDITCGFRAYTVEFCKDTRINLNQPWLERYEMEFYLHYAACRFGYRICEVPVTIDYSHLEKGRKSKITPLKGWWSMTRPFIFLRLGLKK